jgi:integrase
VEQLGKGRAKSFPQTKRRLLRCKKVGSVRSLHSLETSDRKLADRKLADWLGTVASISPSLSKGTLEELLVAFKAARSGCRPSTITAEDGFAKAFRDYFDCQRRVSAMKPSGLKTWVGKTATSREYATNTYNRLCLFTRQLFELAKNDGMTAVNIYGLSELKYKPVHREIPEIPTEEQFENILTEVWREKKNRKAVCSADFLEFEGRAGLGQAEASTLCWPDIDFDGGSTIEEKGKPLGEMKIKRVKTGKYFTVPIYPKLRPLLERMRDEATARAEKEEREWNRTERVFTIDNARKSLTNACERLNYPAFTQRNLQQMFIVGLFRAGVDVKTIAEWQEHQDGGKLIWVPTRRFSEPTRNFMPACNSPSWQRNSYRVRTRLKMLIINDLCRKPHKETHKVRRGLLISNCSE